MDLRYLDILIGVSLIFAIIFISGCTTSLPSYRLTCENSSLAIKENGTYYLTNRTVFKRGENISLLLFNVGKFKKGPDGLNYVGAKLKIEDYKSGHIISAEDILGQEYSLKDMLGEKGHVNLINDTVPYLAGTFRTSPNTKPGNYTITIIFYDKVRDREGNVSWGIGSTVEIT